MSGPSKEKMNQIREGKVRTWPILPSRSTDRLGQCPRPLNLADDGDGADESPSSNGDNGIPRHQTVKNGQPRQAGSPSPNGDNAPVLGDSNSFGIMVTVFRVLKGCLK
jgi:hypothetical protein